jgi:hypothetical protein
MLSCNNMLSTEVGGRPRARRSCYVNEPAYGFFIAGSSIKAMNGIYIRRNPPASETAQAKAKAAKAESEASKRSSTRSQALMSDEDEDEDEDEEEDEDEDENEDEDAEGDDHGPRKFLLYYKHMDNTWEMGLVESKSTVNRYFGFGREDESEWLFIQRALDGSSTDRFKHKGATIYSYII